MRVETGGHEAVIWVSGGVIDMRCNWFSDYCSTCMISGDDSAVPAGEIIEVVKASTSAEMALVARAYGDRLFFNAERRLLLIRGTACSPDAEGGMLVVSNDQARALAAQGLSALSSFLEEEREKYVLGSSRISGLGGP